MGWGWASSGRLARWVYTIFEKQMILVLAIERASVNQVIAAVHLTLRAPRWPRGALPYLSRRRRGCGR
jgi:hypothetical protein